MKPFDDSIPEEIETHHIELLSMLRKASPGSVQITPEAQEEMLERARARLLLSGQPDAASDEQATQTVGPVNSMPPEPASLPVPVRRKAGIARFASLLAAVLVVAAIIGAALLLFQNRQTTISSPGKLPENTVTARSTAGGLEMTLSITPGPYFLSEMLAADISLTNHTQSTVYVGIPFAGSACGYTTGVQVTGQDAPEFMVPISMDHSCPAFNDSTPIKAGQTLTVQKYLTIQNAGKLTLTAETSFYEGSRRSNNLFPKAAPNPLAGHWPSLQITVSSKVPADRKISYQRNGSRVFIDAPSDAQHPLLYLYGVSCSDYNDQGGTGSGNYGWQALQKNVVGEPGCPGKNVQWSFAFGLPGYGIVQGSVTFPGNSPNP